MKISELIKKLKDIQDEIGDGGQHHSIAGEVDIYCEDVDLEIVMVEPWQLGGCGCVVGATIVVKKLKES